MTLRAYPEVPAPQSHSAPTSKARLTIRLGTYLKFRLHNRTLRA
jgi:hypothetical protein